MKQLSDEQLLTAHLDGRPDAFDHLVSRYANELYAFLCRLVGNATAADDLVQEAFVQVHVSAASFDPQRRFRPWLYTIAANKGRDYLRAQGRRPERSLDLGIGNDDEAPTGARLLPSDIAAPDIELDDEEQRRAVRELLDQMPEHLRTILLLGYFQQVPYAEIAEILDVPLGTVKSRMHAAVTQFAKRWHELLNAATVQREAGKE